MVGGVANQVGERIAQRLDHGPIQDKTRDRKAALPVRLSDVLQRALAQQSVRPDPVCAAESGETLVDVVLDVGGRSGDILKGACGRRNRAVRRLRHGNRLVA